MRDFIGGPNDMDGVGDEESGDESGVEAVFIGTGNDTDDEDFPDLVPHHSDDEDNEESNDHLDEGRSSLEILVEVAGLASAIQEFMQSDAEPWENASQTRIYDDTHDQDGRPLGILEQNRRRLLAEGRQVMIPMDPGLGSIGSLGGRLDQAAAFLANIRDDSPLQIWREREASVLLQSGTGTSEGNLPAIRINRAPISPNSLKPAMERTTVPTGVGVVTSSVSSVSAVAAASATSPTNELAKIDNNAPRRAQGDTESGYLKLPSSQSPSTHLRRLSTPEPEDSPPPRDPDEILTHSAKKTGENSLLSSPYFGTPKKEKYDSPRTNDNSPFYSNPMESEVDGESVAACRGDCIGNTTYSERQVIKILMKWMKELEPEQATTEDCVDSGHDEILIGADAPKEKELSSELDEELSLLWDLSSETDVIEYLVEKNVYTFIKDTLAVSSCSRLKEIALGIFANILSSRNILDTFPSTDVELGLISMIISEIQVASDVALLVQAFSVLERVVWYINEVNVNKSWIICMLNLEFVNAVNFLLESSTNALLLGKILVTVLPLFETLSRVNVFETEDCEPEDLDFETRMAQNYDVFCETAHISSLYEGLMELVKSSSENDTELDDVQIPPGHVQTAICTGLACLCYLQKFKSGLIALTKDSGLISNFLQKFFGRFHLYTGRLEIEKAFEYFASGLNLLSFCHRASSELDSSTLYAPIQAAIIFIEREELKKHDLLDLLNSVGVAIHEHLAELGDKFGQEKVYSYVEKESEKFRKFLKFVEDASKYFESKVATVGTCTLASANVTTTEILTEPVVNT